MGANDAADLTRLGAAEGTPGAGSLATSITVTTLGVEDGQMLSLVSDLPAAGTVVATGQVLANSVSFAAVLDEGDQTLTASVSDLLGNPNDPITNPEPEVDVMVDVTPGTATIPAASFSPYAAANGTINDAATPGDTSDDTLDIEVVVSVSDGSAPLDDAQVTLNAYASALCTGSPSFTETVTLSGGSSTAVFSAVPLSAGENCLDADLLDAANNASDSVDQPYGADLYGPTLTLVTSAQGVVQAPGACPSAAPCVTDILDPQTNSNRAQLDTTFSDPFDADSGGAGVVDDLLFTLTDCENAGSFESCAAGITTRLESRIVGGDPTFLAVFESTFGATGDTAVATGLRGDGGTIPGFEPGLVREVRLYAMDQNGNTSTSASVFLALDHSGVLVEVERLDAALTQTGEFFADDLYFGAAENVGISPNYLLNAQVELTALPGEDPESVSIIVNGTPIGPISAVGLTEVVFSGVNAIPLNLSTDPDAPVFNTLEIEVNCTGGVPCGPKTFTGVVADIEGPTFEFDRQSLCALSVPLTDGTWCTNNPGSTGTGDTDANISGADAIWNAALDPNAEPSDGFTTTPAVPLTVLVNGLESGETVRIDSSGAGVTGNEVQMSSGMAVFNNLGVPTLAGSNTHILSVSFTDRAGNAATVVTGRGTEEIVARADTLAPSGATPLVCIGESTTPTAIADPTSDARTFEDPACTAICAATSNCSRRDGDATLEWTAPGDDGAGGDGNGVASYNIYVAARQVTYSGGATPYTYATCDDVDFLSLQADYEQIVAVAPTAAPGTPQQATVSNLMLHRSYCFAVAGVDDVGNETSVTGFEVERTVPLITHPQIIALDPLDPEDDAADGALYTSGSSSFGREMVTLGDLDGDLRDDFAVSHSTAGNVEIFLSGSADLTTPDISIAPPTGGLSSFFGRGIASGDFDNDGLMDLAICHVGADSSPEFASGGAFAGALYLYYGEAGDGIRTDANPNAVAGRCNAAVYLSRRGHLWRSERSVLL